MFRTESYHCLFHSSWLATCQISYDTATVVYTLLTFALTWWAESLHYLQISYATTTVVYSLLIFALTWWAESLHYLLWVFVFGFNLFLWWTHCYFGLITIKLVTIYFNDDHVSIVGLVAIKLFINYRFTWWAESLYYLQISYATTTVVYSLLIFALTWWAESLHYLLWVFVFGFNLFLWWTHCYFGLITIKLVTIYFNDDHVSIVGLVAIKLFINYRFTPVSFLLQLYQVCVVNFIANLLNCSPHFFLPLLSPHYSPAEFIGHYWKGGNVSVWLIHSV